MRGSAFVAAASAVAAVTLGAAPAHAALDFKPCAQPTGVECATVEVPIDRSGRVPGTFSLLVHRVAAPKPSGRPPMVFLTGGPGQVNTQVTTLAARRYAPALKDRDLIVFAQRGTGPTNITCPELERGDDPATAMPACADRLGPARNFYTSRDAADDLDDIRQAIGVDKVALYGASYGSWVSLGYAIRHPQHVETMVLESTYGPDLNADPFGLGLFATAPGLARAICHGDRCRGITRDPWKDVLRLFAKLQEKPLDARVFDSRGRAHKIAISGLAMAALLPGLDFDSHLRSELNRAIAGALKGDAAPLARLVAGAPSGPPPDARLAQNDTLFTVTHCEEDVHPWDRASSPQDRLAEARRRFDQIPASSFDPFGADIAFLLSNVGTCAHWPMLPEQPSFGGGPPADVPVLFLHGQFDLRTPLSSTDAVAKQFPQATVLTIPDAGHSPSRRDAEPCARNLVNTWFAKGTASACRGVKDPFAPRPIVPKEAKPVVAAQLTVADALDQLDAGTGGRPELQAKVKGGGLRGGTFRGLPHGGLRLHRYEFVKGFPVSGTVRPRGTVVLKVRGRVLRFPPRGRVRLQRLTIAAQYKRAGKYVPAA